MPEQNLVETLRQNGVETNFKLGEKLPDGIPPELKNTTAISPTTPQQFELFRSLMVKVGEREPLVPVSDFLERTNGTAVDITFGGKFAVYYKHRRPVDRTQTPGYTPLKAFQFKSGGGAESLAQVKLYFKEYSGEMRTIGGRQGGRLESGDVLIFAIPEKEKPITSSAPAQAETQTPVKAIPQVKAQESTTQPPARTEAINLNKENAAQILATELKAGRAKSFLHNRREPKGLDNRSFQNLTPEEAETVRGIVDNKYPVGGSSNSVPPEGQVEVLFADSSILPQKLNLQPGQKLLRIAYNVENSDRYHRRGTWYEYMILPAPVADQLRSLFQTEQANLEFPVQTLATALGENFENGWEGNKAKIVAKTIKIVDK